MRLMQTNRGRDRSAEIQLDIFRRMTPSERLDCAFRWTSFTYEIARGAIRGEHPDWTDARVDREIGRRITGIDVTKLNWEKIRRPRAGTP